MELVIATAELYVGRAFEGMLAVADRLGPVAVNRRPFGAATNSVSALIVHCCGVTEFWIGHVVLGRPDNRDRAAEFSTTATVEALHHLVNQTLRTLHTDFEAIEAGRTTPVRGDWGHFERVPDRSDAAVVVHVLEELYQHLGHIELTADALQ